MLYKVNNGLLNNVVSGWEISESGMIYIALTPDQVDLAIRALRETEQKCYYIRETLKEFKYMRQCIQNSACAKAYAELIH